MYVSKYTEKVWNRIFCKGNPIMYLLLLEQGTRKKKEKEEILKNKNCAYG
jgi:hypothetical protein